MEIPGVDQLTRATCAEMILGMDVRIFFEPKLNDGNPQPGEYSLNVDVQQPLGGRALGLHRDKELEGKANSAYKYDFAGTVQFSDTTTFPHGNHFLDAQFQIRRPMERLLLQEGTQRPNPAGRAKNERQNQMARQ